MGDRQSGAGSDQSAFDAVILVGDGAGARVGGMTLLERAAFTVARAGARRILGIGSAPAAPPRLPSVPFTWCAPTDGPGRRAWVRDAAPVVVGLDACVVVDAATVRALAAAEGDDPRTVAGAILWRTSRTAAGASPIADLLVSPGVDGPQPRPWNPPKDALVAPARTAPERHRAEEALYARLGRPGDGWFTRFVDRRISRAITRRVAHLPVTPNHLTLFSIGLGITGGLLFASGTPAAALAGALLFLASTILDGCDGELARLTCRESTLGARLDLIGDNVVHLFLFGGIAFGLHRHAPSPRLAAVGVLLVVGVLLAMATVFATIVRRPPTPAQRTLFEAFGSREFAYLLLVLTAVGRLEWFLWLSAVGTYAFVLGLLLLGRRSPA